MSKLCSFKTDEYPENRAVDASKLLYTAAFNIFSDKRGLSKLKLSL